jgi:hypothetical protein
MSEKKALTGLSLAIAAASLLLSTPATVHARYQSLLNTARSQNAQVAISKSANDNPAPLVLTNGSNAGPMLTAQHSSHDSHSSHSSHASHASHASHSSGL